MTYDGNQIDSVLTMELRDAVSELAMPERPPLTMITSKGRAYQRRRLAGITSLGLTVAAAGAVLALGLTATPHATPVKGPNAVRSTTPANSSGTIRTPAFILTSNVNGTDTLTLTMSQMLDPATLQQALTEHGIPALVESGTYCMSSPKPPDPVSAGVLSIQLPAAPHIMVPAPNGPAPSQVTQMAAHTVTMIDPAALPAGTELFFGYSSDIHAVFTDLIDIGSYTCSDTP
jgi:hypothetical protein